MNNWWRKCEVFFFPEGPGGEESEGRGEDGEWSGEGEAEGGGEARVCRGEEGGQGGKGYGQG